MEIVYSLLKAFLAGGLICAIGQILLDKTKLTPARILTSFVVAGVVLHGLGVYAPFKEMFGAGAGVPIMGFGSALAQGVKDAVAKDGLIGALTGGFTAGAAGIAAAVFFGIIVSLVFKAKSKE
ncbi:MAG: stage V sporulation protein AE [Oscillospiraceae bacterium]|jgi:stage V sporulation protein AE|nr:stage V sporulation protein AE [Oscillospiraceae bacterium]